MVYAAQKPPIDWNELYHHIDVLNLFLHSFCRPLETSQNLFSASLEER